jgi:hypothetical protein
MDATGHTTHSHERTNSHNGWQRDAPRDTRAKKQQQHDLELTFKARAIHADVGTHGVELNVGRVWIVCPRRHVEHALCRVLGGFIPERAPVRGSFGSGVGEQEVSG